MTLLSRLVNNMVRFLQFRRIILCGTFAFIGQIILSQSIDFISVKAIPNRDFAIPGSGDYFMARFGDCTYKVKPNGLVTKYFLNTTDSTLFKLDLEKGFGIEYAEFNYVGNYLIVCYTVTDSETGSSYITIFDLQSLKKIWTYSKLAPNLSRLKINNNYIYITSFSVVVKLDLSSGDEVFRLDGLYDRGKYSFNSFSDVIFKGDTVTFLSKNWFSKRLDKVVVNDRTNSLIMIDK